MHKQFSIIQSYKMITVNQLPDLSTCIVASKDKKGNLNLTFHINVPLSGTSLQPCCWSYPRQSDALCHTWQPAQKPAEITVDIVAVTYYRSLVIHNEVWSQLSFSAKIYKRRWHDTFLKTKASWGLITRDMQACCGGRSEISAYSMIKVIKTQYSISLPRLQQNSNSKIHLFECPLAVRNS